MKFYMQGKDLVTLYKLYDKGNEEGRISPFLEAEQAKFECYINYHSKWIDVNIYDGDKLVSKFEIDKDKSEQAARYIFFKELCNDSYRPKWYENKPQNILFDYVRNNEDREKLNNAVNKDIPIYYTFNSRMIPFLENAVVTASIKFIIDPEQDQMQWVDNKVNTFDEELKFSQEQYEKAALLPHEKLISLLQSRLKQYDPLETVRWIKLYCKAANIINENDKDLQKNNGSDMEL